MTCAYFSSAHGILGSIFKNDWGEMTGKHLSFVFNLRKLSVQQNGTSVSDEEDEDECSDVLQIAHSGL